MPKKRSKKLGIAFGAGGAKGLAHIGILKVLHKHGIQPDCLAGTSMGAVIGAMYAAGHSPEDIEEIAKTTDWKSIVDFTIPKLRLLRGELVEQRLRKLVYGKDFSELTIPLHVVAYDLTTHKRVIFSEGDVAKAVRASLSIPGIFSPLRIGRHYYIDGGVTDPTPFDVVKEMGADIIIAVDLFTKEKTVTGPIVHKKSLFAKLQEQFIAAELTQLKNLIFPEEWPDFLRRMFVWIFDRILYPARIVRILAGRELPPIAKIMNETIHILSNNLARERLAHADIHFKVTPSFKNIGWSDFDNVEQFVNIGTRAMERHIPELKKALGR
jgi:predicted acylesterase/phospholipase RssA